MMQPDHENPKIGVLLGMAMIAGFGLMAAQLWDASQSGTTGASPRGSTPGHRVSGNPAHARAATSGMPAVSTNGMPKTVVGASSEATTADDARPVAAIPGSGPSAGDSTVRRTSAGDGKNVTSGFETLADEGRSPPVRSGQQGEVKIPLRADPGIQHLSRGEAEPDMDLALLPASRLESAYRRLDSSVEREAFLNELTATGRDHLPKILETLFQAESDPMLKESILAAASDVGSADQYRGLLLAALDARQTVDVRLAALYYASDLAPDLVKRYVNDANVDIREEARNLADSDVKP